MVIMLKKYLSITVLVLLSQAAAIPLASSDETNPNQFNPYEFAKELHELAKAQIEDHNNFMKEQYAAWNSLFVAALIAGSSILAFCGGVFAFFNWRTKSEVTEQIRQHYHSIIDSQIEHHVSQQMVKYESVLSERLKQQKNDLIDLVKDEIEKAENAMRLASAHMHEIVVTPEETQDMARSINNAPLTAQRFIFQQAQELRHSLWDKNRGDQIARTVTIFRALIGSKEFAEGNHRLYAQLGYALKDGYDPEDSVEERWTAKWAKAYMELTTAIRIRDRRRRKSSPMYEFSRALCGIKMYLGKCSEANIEEIEMQIGDTLKYRIIEDVKIAIQDNVTRDRLINLRDDNGNDWVGDWLRSEGTSFEQLRT